MAYKMLRQSIWSDENIKSLSDSAKLLFVYLITNKNTNSIGLYYLPLGHIKDDLGWEKAGFNKAMSELTKHELAYYDEDNNLVFVKNYLKYNPIWINAKKLNPYAVKTLRSYRASKLLELFLNTVLKDESFLNLGMNSELIKILSQMYAQEGADKNNEKKTVANEISLEEQESEDKKLPKVNKVNEVVNLWNEVCGKFLPKVKALPNARRMHVLARIKEFPELNWKELFEQIIKTSFLLGDNDKGWRADFDWVMNPNNLVKIIEGKYAHIKPNKQENNQQNKQQSTSHLWGFCRVCKKETLKTNLVDGYCQNCHPNRIKAEKMAENIKEILENISKPMPKIEEQNTT